MLDYKLCAKTVNKLCTNVTIPISGITILLRFSLTSSQETSLLLSLFLCCRRKLDTRREALENLEKEHGNLWLAGSWLVTSKILTFKERLVGGNLISECFPQLV